METFWNKLLTKFDRKIGPPTGQYGCLEWQGARDRCGYGRIFVFWPGREKEMEEKAHRVAFYLQYQLSPTEFKWTDAEGRPAECSHVCHNPSCVRIDHLIIERHSSNMERIHCRQQGTCSKTHKPYCMI